MKDMERLPGQQGLQDLGLGHFKWEKDYSLASSTGSPLKMGPGVT